MRNLAILLLERMRESQAPCSIYSNGGNGLFMSIGGGEAIYDCSHMTTEDAIEKFIQFHIEETIKKTGFM